MTVKILVTIIVLLIGVMRVLYCLLSDRRTLAWSERMQQAGIFGRDQNGDPAIIMPVEAARALRLLAESAKKTGRWRSRRRIPEFLVGISNAMVMERERGGDFVVSLDVLIETLDTIAYALDLFRGDREARKIYDAVNDDASIDYDAWMDSIEDLLRFYDV